MYSVTYKTKKGGSGVQTSSTLEPIKKKVISLFKQKLSATVYKDGVMVGKVFEDDSERLGWNWFIENDDFVRS
jgi:hypothetical protein